jgi:uncharacterized protein (DUF885 family)
MPALSRGWLTLVLSVCILSVLVIIAQPVPAGGQTTAQPVDVAELQKPASEVRGLIERFETDEQSLNRSLPVRSSSARRDRMKAFYSEWLSALNRVDFDRLGQDGKIDALLFKNHLDHELRRIEIETKRATEEAPLLPFTQAITDLEEARRRMEPLDSERTAALLTRLNKQIEEARKGVEAGLKPDGKTQPIKASKTLANRAAGSVTNLRNTLRRWHTFYSGYDPVFTWWVGEPYKTVDQSLQNYANFLKERVVGVKPGDDTAIVGDPIGREALLSELAYEMIPYTPEELVEIANKEFAWCEAEMKRAARDMGLGDDWKKALEQVKTQHVPPGKQPELIRTLAEEAIAFVEKNDLVTVPPLAKETWRMEMMTPERQLVNPFFTGGEVISVSFPTSGMTHEQKMMSLRGNNIHFSRATVFHELIPGHHLQGFMEERYKPYRRVFNTPFWVEGGALYWEMVFWDRDFPKSPENRVGMLFWRMHRCARIIFSLSFHLGKMTPEQCIDFLVDRVGHERDNAMAEVRRSFAGNYGPLYQCAYMLGGLQLRALHKELVGGGRMTDRAFNDAVLQENAIPIEMVRASLTKQPLTRDFKPGWKFYGEKPGR